MKASAHEIVIRPASGWPRLDLRELWEYRSLLLLLAWRDLLLRYKQTAIGVAWALVQPLSAMVVLTIVFGSLVGLSSNQVPYHMIVLSGMLPWQLFATAFSNASLSITGSAHVIGKIYFPRLIIPSSAVLSAVPDFLVALLVLLALAAYHGLALRPHLLLVLPIAAWVLFAALGLALWLAALSVRYRDVKHIVPFLVSIGFYASPVGFSLSVLPGRYRDWYALNPMVGPIECFRWAVLGDAFVPRASAIGFSLAVVTISVAGGVYFFRSREIDFADLI